MTCPACTVRDHAKRLGAKKWRDAIAGFIKASPWFCGVREGRLLYRLALLLEEECGDQFGTEWKQD
jgi:hypothetical protein